MAPRRWPERFWEKVDKTGDCWVWIGPLNRGYGMVSYLGETRRAHRIAYELQHGPIADGLVLDHLCRNRACVRPEHLEAVRQATNAQRGEQARITMDDAREIRARIVAGELQGSIAEDYAVSIHTIHWIAEDIMWREDWDAPRQPVRPAGVFCPECGVEITSGKRNKKFCCARHRDRFNDRVRYHRL
jgi:hypothetical protein